MSTASNASQINSIMGTLNEGLASAQPDLGYGYDGERPPAGNHDCYLIGWDVDAATFTKADGNKIPALRFTANWKLISDPNHATQLEWKGESMLIPQGGSRGLPQGDRNGDDLAKKTSLTRWFVERDEARLRGILETVLNRPFTNIMADVAAVQQLLQNGTLVGVQVKCEYSPNKKRPGEFYFREYAQKNLASVTQAVPPSRA